jgi:excisionase family DNA binding protein
MPRWYHLGMIVDENEVYTPQETISILKISDSTFRRLIKSGVLQAGKIGGQYRILGKNILKLLNPNLPKKVKQMYKKIVQEV